MRRVLVTGGTGGLGREIVNRLVQTGQRVRVMSRKSELLEQWPSVEWVQGDLVTGAGLEKAVTGVDTIIHAATKSGIRRDGNGIDFGTALNTSDNVDVGGTRLLLEHAHAANVEHFIYVSIVGMERVPFPYYVQKLAAEKLVTESSIPWTIMRATQFHAFVSSLLKQAAHLPILPLATDMQFQPVDTGEVAEYLCSLVEQPPAGRLPDFGGPEVHTLGELANIWLTTQGIRKPVIHTPLPNKTVAAIRKGYLTCPQRKCGTITWAQWVQQKLAPAITDSNAGKQKY